MHITTGIKMLLLSIFLTSTSLQATAYEDGNNAAQKGDISSALKHWEKACETEGTGGCQNAARVYDFANGVTEDDKKALPLYTKACNAGYAYSCARSALIYEEGLAVTQDVDKAFKLYTKACGGGDMFACHNIALSYAKKGDKQSKKIAFNFYKLACNGGYADSCIYLGRVYRDGKGLTNDLPKAKKYFSLACDAHNRLGCKEVRILEGLGY